MAEDQKINDGACEAAHGILDALRDTGFETSEELEDLIITDIQRLAVAPVEAERDEALALLHQIVRDIITADAAPSARYAHERLESLANSYRHLLEPKDAKP